MWWHSYTVSDEKGNLVAIYLYKQYHAHCSYYIWKFTMIAFVLLSWLSKHIFNTSRWEDGKQKQGRTRQQCIQSWYFWKYIMIVWLTFVSSIPEQWGKSFKKNKTKNMQNIKKVSFNWDKQQSWEWKNPKTTKTTMNESNF